MKLSTRPGLARTYASALMRSLPGLGPNGGVLPDTTLSLPGFFVSRSHLSAYADVCGFPASDRLPATYPHVLAFPMAMRLMSDRSFPFPLMGLVHIRNVITVAQPILASDPLELRVFAENLGEHPRGAQFDVVSEAYTADGLAVTSRSTYLHRSSSGGGGGNKPEPPQMPPTAVWRLPADIGRRYAAVSGDRNPIHLSAASARVFGFRTAIAHGMYTKARCLATLDARLPETYEVAVSFRQPLPLPSRAAFRASQSAAGWRFSVDGRAPHLDGALSPASSGGR
ncbi:MaoC/PaaZ C-terminal domain-containing protein [Fodinicola acaciae]|uniref:MaoC/PaaZ C-terminal domain-containing protein n=1 Tax=Fodinicola acaciae TaxID=2681555 RepID=UPI0013D2AE56|nr:MaoC/PaaZ C-terminal domain-containing protein [Fodinicola acaciae]